MQILGKFDFKINIIPNGLEKYMSLIISLDNKLVCTDCFPFLSSSLEGLVKNVDDNDFKYLSQESGSEY